MTLNVDLLRDDRKTLIAAAHLVLVCVDIALAKMALPPEFRTLVDRYVMSTEEARAALVFGLEVTARSRGASRRTSIRARGRSQRRGRRIRIARKANGERRAFFGRGLNVDRSAVCLHNAIGDEQAEPQIARIALDTGAPGLSRLNGLKIPKISDDGITFPKLCTMITTSSGSPSSSTLIGLPGCSVLRGVARDRFANTWLIRASSQSPSAIANGAHLEYAVGVRRLDLVDRVPERPRKIHRCAHDRHA